MKDEWWEAIHIDTGQTPAVSQPKGPRHIYFDNFQVEARQSMDCAGGAAGVQCSGGVLPPAIPPQSANIHIVHANDVYWEHSSISNAGQGKSALLIDGDVNNPVRSVALRASTIGGNPQLAGFLTCTAVANSVCTLVSGNQFLPFDSNSWTGITISIPAAACTTSCVVASIQSATQITLTTNTGSITNTAYTVTSGGWGVTASWVNNLILDATNWLGNPLGNLNPTTAGTQNYQFAETFGTAPGLATGDTFGDQQCLGSNCAMGFQNNTPSTGQRWTLNSLSTGILSISPATGNSLQDLNLGGSTKIPNNLKIMETAWSATQSGLGFDDCYGESTTHVILCSNNGAAAQLLTPLKQTISGADYTNATVTPSTVFSFSLPPTAGAASYRYSCDILWESTAATLVGPVFGLNLSAAPVQLTGNAKVSTALAGAYTTGYLSNTTTGHQVLITSAAAGVTTTNYEARIWGTIEGAATAGSTFIIDAASTSGSTALLNIRRGGGCML